MSETRYSPEVIEANIDTPGVTFRHSHETNEQLQQGASDARVIAQLREWLRQGEQLDMPTTGDFYDGLRQGISNTILELDRLTHPAEEAEK